MRRFIDPRLGVVLALWELKVPKCPIKNPPLQMKVFFLGFANKITFLRRR